MLVGVEPAVNDFPVGSSCWAQRFDVAGTARLPEEIGRAPFGSTKTDGSIEPPSDGWHSSGVA